jgi:hypothetical protein
VTTQAVLNRDAAVDRVGQYASRVWLDAAYEAVKQVARANREFTSDDVWDMLAEGWPDLPVREPRALGAVLTRAARNEVARIKGCHSCGTRKVMVASRRSQANGMDTPVYVSLIFGQRDPNLRDVEGEGTLW